MQKRDTNHDGRFDVTTWYRGGQPCNAQTDTNADGKPDLWEEHDEAEALVGRSRDYNYDGTPDYTQKKPVAVS